jgi:hypothetical protein
VEITSLQPTFFAAFSVIYTRHTTSIASAASKNITLIPWTDIL